MKHIVYILRHPADGFWEMKNNRKGSMKEALALLAATVISLIFDHQARDFVFNPAYNTSLNILKEICIVILPVMLFTLANWTITTLSDGKGNLKEIFFVVCYSLVPIIIFRVGVPILSHLFSLNELAYLNMLDIIGFAWAGIMIFIGIMEIHEYTFKKMLGTLVLTVVSAAIIVFVVMLSFSLLQEILSFVYSIYREISLRI